MAKGNSQEERQLIKFIEELHISDDEKNAWSELIRNGSMSNELAEEIRVKLAEPVDTPEYAAAHTRYQAELANLVRRWRFSSQSHNFGRH
jgi:hypothetical protein